MSIWQSFGRVHSRRLTVAPGMTDATSSNKLACSEIIYAVGKGILEDKILKKLSPSQLSVTVRVQVLVGSSYDPNSGFSHLSPQRFCQGYFSDGSGSKLSLLCSFIMVNSVCVSKMMCHQILHVIYISRSQP